LPAALDSNFRSGEVKSRIFKDNRGQVFEYRVFSHSLIRSAYRDSTLTCGLIIPRSSLVAIANENKMIFGTDSLQCSIHYFNLDIYKSAEQSSLLMDIIFPPDKQRPGYDRYERTNTPYMRMVAGTLQHPLMKDEVRFHFEHAAAAKDFDSARIKGYLKAGNDSFFIHPFFKEIPLHGKNVKPMQVLQGYCLMKEDTLYAFLQHAPMVKYLYKPGLKDLLFLYSKASPAEQMMMAAYFSLVSSLVTSVTSRDVLY
jgi:hypothetical protein